MSVNVDDVTEEDIGNFSSDVLREIVIDPHTIRLPHKRVITQNTIDKWKRVIQWCKIKALQRTIVYISKTHMLTSYRNSNVCLPYLKKYFNYPTCTESLFSAVWITPGSFGTSHDHLMTQADNLRIDNDVKDAINESFRHYQVHDEYFMSYCGGFISMSVVVPARPPKSLHHSRISRAVAGSIFWHADRY